MTWRRPHRCLAGRGRVRLFGLRLGLSLLTGSHLAAQAPRQGPRELPVAARQVYEGVMSPFCPELLLANCPSPQADSLRRAIAVRAAAGATRDALVADLVATYGDVVRAAPAPRGAGLIAWVVPGLALVLGAAAVWRWLARSAERGTTDRGARASAEPVAPDATRDGARTNGTPAELDALDALVRRG